MAYANAVDHLPPVGHPLAMPQRAEWLAGSRDRIRGIDRSSWQMSP
jgi:hypothetical protein